MKPKGMLKGKILSQDKDHRAKPQECGNCVSGKVGKRDCIACGGTGRRRK